MHSGNILADFLRKNQAEVIAMSIFEYDKVEEEKKLRKAEFDAGVEQGLKQASTDTALRLLKQESLMQRKSQNFAIFR